jgi:hypothetical protein
MTNQRRVFLALAGAAASPLLLCGSHAQAQPAAGGSVQSPKPPVTNTNPVPPGGPQHSKMPLATEDWFSNAEKRAPHSSPTGTPGVSK